MHPSGSPRVIHREHLSIPEIRVTQCPWVSRCTQTTIAPGCYASCYNFITQVNWSGLEGIPLLSFQLAALIGISLDISLSCFPEVVPASHKESSTKIHQKCSSMHINTWQNPPKPVWYLLTEDCFYVHPLLDFLFLSQPSFKRLRCYDKTSTKLDFKGQTQREPAFNVKSLGCLPSQLLLITQRYEKQ